MSNCEDSRDDQQPTIFQDFKAKYHATLPSPYGDFTALKINSKYKPNTK